jgi:integrase/recombinase XerD
MDIGLAVKRYVLWMETKNLSPRTIKNYKCQVALFLNHFKDVEKCRLITSEQIMEYLVTKVQSNTQRHAHSAIKLFYTNVVGQTMKMKFIPYAKKEKKLPIPLEVNEILAMISKCENKKHLAIIYLLYGCGLRVSEVINLKWSHIERNAGVIHIIQAKGKKDRRVPLFADLLRVLTEYYREFKSECNGQEYLFVGQYGGQYTERSINNVLKQLAAKAGIKSNVHAHLLRHSYSSHLLENGVDLKVIQELLGHSSLKTTEIYLHISKAHIRKVPSPMQLAIINNQ